ncbi:prolipoprotein diacylglyceryl transferase [Dysgonomonas sp. Marseille-P4677]|uniref:prolipoprotein diacylglyceryl transferase n=1 Tax=Dysgonomonas sp. Marseille-P4677 TaxID=2364790 RepID=UPI0019120717|nr:prolipoprotein diacylglyceryl transferase [Dysgonomonas sp. Marseille-P4677]MBK5722548.1 prolipoprotein diacylglyceryl transferase [Dysgonomonas sp. Marseille-P4677]
MLSFITWDIDPEAFSLFGREIRWYGILWATGVLCTSLVVQKMYKSEKLPDKWFDSLFIYVLTGLIIGARLGHCLFYEPLGYLSNPLSLLEVWKGGLASHGGAIGMVIGVCLYSLSITNKKLNWKYIIIAGLFGFIIGGVAKYISDPTNLDGNLGIAFLGLSVGVCIAMLYTSYPTAIQSLDRLIVGVAIGATFIRLGNLMNHEIYGGALDKPWAFRFILNLDKWKQGAEPIYSLPSHPTQIYEALTYFCVFLIGMFLYYKTNARKRTGLILGISLIGIFLSRFIVEFIKNAQVDYEADMILNMGQLLSIPFVIWGIWLVWSALSRKDEIVPTNNNKTK